jgi:hypothetical protein
MKKYSLLLLFIAIMLNGCDNIDAPYGVNTIDTSSGGNNVVSKVLLEDYTGHACNTCPLAHAEALRLSNLFGDRLVVMSIHTSSTFAKPLVTPDNSFNYDFRTTTGNDIATSFSVISGTGAALTPFPQGIIDRAPDPSGNTIIGWGLWEAAVSARLDKEVEAGLQISLNYDSLTRKVNASVTISAVKEIASPASLAVYLTEDSVVNWQKNGAVNDPNYIHRHVLRGCLTTNSIGESVGVFTAGESKVKSYSNYTLPLADINARKVSVIAVLSDGTSRQVIQVEDKKLFE